MVRTTKIFLSVQVGLLLAIGNPSSAAECSSLSLVQNAKQSLQGSLGDPVDLSGDSRFPFLGSVERSECSAEHSSCQVMFKVEEYFFNSQDVLYEMLGRQAEHIQYVSVTFDGISGIEFPVKTEWFVIPGHYGSNGGKGSGFVFDTSCGSSLARYSEGSLVLQSNEVVPYADLKKSLLGMVTPEALERLRRELRKIMSSRLQ